MNSPRTSATGLLRRPAKLASRLRYVPFPADVWCPLLRSDALKAGACRAEMLLGTRVVIFRGRDGAVHALEDRCPHRGVALSLGAVRGDCMQCAYHGWTIRGDGTVLSVPGVGRLEGAPRARRFAVREHAGLIWAFLGAPEFSDSVPLPDVAPYGTSQSVDLAIPLVNETHWSLLLDNGLDLFHGHLHRGVPYFFEIHELEDYAIQGETLSLTYRASIGAAFNTRRKGRIVVTVSTATGGARLDFDGLPTVSVIATPHAADGTRLTAWYLFSFCLPAHQRFFLKLTLPFVRRALVRGFTQDAHILAAELRAMREGVLVQNEINPLLLDMHEHVAPLLAQRALAAVRRRGDVQVRRREQVLAEARQGTLAVLGRRDDRIAFLSPPEAEEALPHEDRVSVVSYFHYCLVEAPPAQTQPK